MIMMMKIPKMKTRKMKNNFFYCSVIILICLAALAGCNKTVKDVINAVRGSSAEEAAGDDWHAEKLKKDTGYYNDFLGISYSVPKGWWLYEVNEENFGKSKGDITDDISMDILFGQFYDYNFSSIWLMAFGNLEKSEKDNHLGFDLDARSIDGINDMAGYMKYFEAFMLEPEEDKEYKLTDSRQITVNEKKFELRDYLVTREDSVNYHIVTLTCQVKNGYFFNIKADYWTDNTRAINAVIDSVGKAVKFY